MNISDDPIKIDDEKTLSLERFYAEFNEILESIVEDDASPDARKRESERCVSLCRTAVGAFTYLGQLREVRKVVAHFNNFASIIIEAGVFKLSQEFDILTYCPGVETESQVRAEKARLSREFLPKLYGEGTRGVAQPQKHPRAALFQGLEGMAEFYRNRYGLEPSDTADRKASNEQ